MPADHSPTARALRTLEILQTRPGTTAGELGERLGVTERAARRYIASFELVTGRAFVPDTREPVARIAAALGATC